MSGEDWGCSIVERVMLERGIAQFLRTHRDGYDHLLAWLDTVPSDRTEAEWQAERAARAQAHEAAIHANLDRFNAYRVAAGLPAINRDAVAVAADNVTAGAGEC